jgi:fatty-acyl-CoA synthase
MKTIKQRQAALAARYPHWTNRTIDAALDAVAADFPDRPFVITDRQSWTYAEMVSWSRRLAFGLVGQGVRRGDNVAVILANYPEFVAIKFAIARVGAVAVPINILNRRDELEYLLRQSDAVLLVTMDRFRDNDYLAALDDIVPGWEQSAGGQALPKLRGVVVFATDADDVAARQDVVGFDALEVDGSGGFGAPGDPQADCDIIYTSGTTGPPKGVLLTHDMELRTAYGSAYARAFEDGRRILFSLPMYHVFGYSEGLLAVLFVGGAIIPQLRFDAVETLAAVERHRATDILLIPAMSLAVLDAVPTRHRDLSSLHSALASGGRAPQRIWQALHDTLGIVEITTGYGMTETTASTTVTRPDDPMARLLHTNGRQRDAGIAGNPDEGNRIVTYRAVDTETGALLPSNEMGELVAKGIGVTRGYYNNPEATVAAFDADGWLKTGDLGSIDDDGYITLIGRSKESYRCGGEQVLPSEIEGILTSHDDVLQAHIVPIRDDRMGEVGVAFIVLKEKSTVSVEELQALASARLARFKVPRHFLLVTEADIPTTASGRARKFLLSQQALRILELA